MRLPRFEGQKSTEDQRNTTLYKRPASLLDFSSHFTGNYDMLKITGLDELTRKLDKLASSAEKLHGTHQVPIGEILDPGFLSSHTRFTNIDELFDASGFGVQSTEDFQAIPTEKLDEFVRSESAFDTWQSMVSEAGKAWALKQLKF